MIHLLACFEVCLHVMDSVLVLYLLKLLVYEGYCMRVLGREDHFTGTVLDDFHKVHTENVPPIMRDQVTEMLLRS